MEIVGPLPFSLGRRSGSGKKPPTPSTSCLTDVVKFPMFVGATDFLESLYRKSLTILSTLGQKSSIYPKIHNLEITIFTKFTIWKSQFSQNSQFENLIFHKIHNFKVSFFTKFTIWKSHFSQNSQFENLIFHKIHIFKVSFFTKFTFTKSHLSQNSHFHSLIFHKIHIFQSSNYW